jgi:hypothetical protein
MIRLVTKEFSQQDWTDIVSGFSDLNLIQTWEYGEAKVKAGPWKVARAILMDGPEVLAACQSMVRPLPFLGGGLVWVNRGPLWRKQDKGDLAVLLKMLGELRRYWVEEHRMYLRVAPPVSQEEGNAALFAPYGYAVVKGASGRASARLDLSRSIETLRRNLQQKWRNCLNKAERLNLTCESGTSEQVFRQVLEEYEEMLRQKKLKGYASPSFLGRLQAYLEEDRKLWGFLGWQGAQRLGGILLARCGWTCEYLAGAFNQKGREVNAGNLLLWQAICKMKELGYRWFDLGGMHPLLTPAGVYHFKSGLKGQAYQLHDELESYRHGWRNRAIRWGISRSRQLS